MLWYRSWWLRVHQSWVQARQLHTMLQTLVTTQRKPQYSNTVLRLQSKPSGKAAIVAFRPSKSTEYLHHSLHILLLIYSHNLPLWDVKRRVLSKSIKFNFFLSAKNRKWWTSKGDICFQKIHQLPILHRNDIQVSVASVLSDWMTGKMRSAKPMIQIQ